MKKYLKPLLILFPVTLFVGISYTNCARFEAANSGSLDSGSLGNLTLDANDSENLGLSTALLSAEQTYTSMLKVTGMDTTTSITNEYNGRYSSLAAGNSLGLANGPLMLGSTSLAGEICNGLISKERVLASDQRTYFGAVNFSAGINTLDDVAFARAVRGMARSFWGRNENIEEYQLIEGFKTEFVTALSDTERNQTASTANFLVAACAAMLSSYEALTY